MLAKSDNLSLRVLRLNNSLLVRRSILRRGDIERRIATERVAMIGTTTRVVVIGEATAAANIPEETLAYDGLTIPMECNHRRARRLVTTNVTTVRTAA